LYLAVILDLHSRRMIGWAVSNRMKLDLAIRALKMAIALRSSPPGCIFHSGSGSHYCSQDYQKALSEYGLQASMRGKGNCYANAAVMPSLQHINRFHNPRRRHSALGAKGPLAFERQVA